MSLTLTNPEVADLVILPALAPTHPALANNAVFFRILVNTGSQLNFIAPSLAKSLPLTLICLSTPLPLQLADSLLAAHPITRYACFSFCFLDNPLSWTIDVYIGQLGHYQAFLGLKWICSNSCHINFSASPEQLLTPPTLPAFSLTVATVVDNLIPVNGFCPVRYWSCQMTAVERCYATYNGKLLAVSWGCE